MVLLSFKFHMNFFHLFFMLFMLFLHFSLSGCVCVFALLHSSIADISFFGINLKERRKKGRLVIQLG